ncbi:MAG TPA: hypothetical protein VJ860_00410 [Polyangia bacterium]|jgi:hypothetical protein|nr:hypothetical protein [Polyangia bacterium]
MRWAQLRNRPVDGLDTNSNVVGVGPRFSRGLARQVFGASVSSLSRRR